MVVAYYEATRPALSALRKAGIRGSGNKRFWLPDSCDMFAVSDQVWEISNELRSA